MPDGQEPKPDYSRRVRFLCWNCQRAYSLLLDFDGRPLLLVECPYCHQTAESELAPYRSAVLGTFASDNADTYRLPALNLPDVLPTRPRREESGQ